MERSEFAKEYRKRLGKEFWPAAEKAFEAFEVHFSDDVVDMIDTALERGLVPAVTATLMKYHQVLIEDYGWDIDDPEFPKTDQYRKVRDDFRKRIYVHIFQEKLLELEVAGKK